MAVSSDKRKLAGVLAPYVAGFSRLTAANESGAVKALGKCQAPFYPLLALHGGCALPSKLDNADRK